MSMGHRFPKFPLAKLSRYAEIFPGFAFKSERFTDNESDLALVKGENVQQGYIDWGASKYWPVSELEAFKKYELHPGDVVLAMDRPWVTAGLKWAYIKPHDPQSLLVQRVSRLRAKNGLDQTYLRSLISSNYFSGYIEPIVTGVNVPHISGKQIGDFKIPLPPRDIQRKIAAILSAYDELIENNKRRIALLEKMAEEIYREWFVRLRFPGHEKVRTVKGLPVGWEERKFGDIYKIAYGKMMPVTKLQPDGKYEVYGAGDVIGRSDLSNCKAKVTLITCRGNGSGTVWHTESSPCFVTNNSFMIGSKGELSIYHYYFIYLHMKTSPIEQALSGSAQPQITIDSLSKVKIMRFPDELVEKFTRLVGPLETQRAALHSQLEIAAKTRDLLLPRLISGKLSVENLDIQFPPGMMEEYENPPMSPLHKKGGSGGSEAEV